MKSRTRKKPAPLPWMFTDLALASWETIARRTMLAAQNQCSPAEYQRMVTEKAQAAMEQGMKFFWSGGTASMAALLAPWHRRAAANAKRLRKKK